MSGCPLVVLHDTVGNLLSVADNSIDPATGARTPASDSIQLVYDDLDQVQLERTVNPLVGTSTILDRDYDLRGRVSQTAVNLGGVIQGTSVSGGIGDLVNQRQTPGSELFFLFLSCTARHRRIDCLHGSPIAN